MSRFAARTAAERLIERFGITTAPIDVHDVAQLLGLRIVADNLGSDVSALLVTEGNTSVIGVNKTHPRKRQRFSIAHEIGHHVMRHQFVAGEHVHVDRGSYISERGTRAAAGIDPKEIEANQFAASMLMPTKLVREHVDRIGYLPLDENDVKKLARDFDVSEQAMTIRLSVLGYV
jgi:Zn-dependent peptidase ImmA (M78 family)